MMWKKTAVTERLRVALRPYEAPSNRFASLFADALDKDRIDPVPFDAKELGHGVNDVVLFHWPNEFFRPNSRKATLIALARMVLDKLRRRTRYVWLVHNLEPHDGGGRPSRILREAFFTLIDGLIFLSESSRHELGQRYPRTMEKRSLVTVHGRYVDGLSEPCPFIPPQGPARLLFFGQIRAYKNIERLIEQSRLLSEDFYLTVLGACTDEDLSRRIWDAAEADPRIRLDLRAEPLEEHDLEARIDAHDAVVLPYRSVLNSGAALHALSRNKPVLVPAIGSLPELSDKVGKDWVHLFSGEIEALHIAGFLRALPSIQESTPDLSPFDWRHVGTDVTEFLCSL